MSEQLAVTILSPTHVHTNEFKLVYRLLREALPKDVKWVTAPLGKSVGKLVEENLNQGTRYVFVVNEASFLPNTLGYEEMRKLLDEHPELQCVLPSDIRGYRPGFKADYFTQRGFEKFSESIYDSSATYANYDGRAPWVALIRARALLDRPIPDNLFEIIQLFQPEQVGIALNAFIHSFADAYNFSREDILPFIPPHIRSILDIGCARGRFGALVKEKLGCRVVGAEFNSYEGQIAQQRLDKVFVGDFLSLDIQERFDCVTCLDVLEHFSEPEVLLGKIRSLLNPGGTLILSVPNIGHWSIVEDLLAGRWDYVPAGILCNTHLRFFTEKSLSDLLESNSYSISILSVLTTKIPDRMHAGLKALTTLGYEINNESLATNVLYAVATPV